MTGSQKVQKTTSSEEIGSLNHNSAFSFGDDLRANSNVLKIERGAKTRWSRDILLSGSLELLTFDLSNDSAANSAKNKNLDERNVNEFELKVLNLNSSSSKGVSSSSPSFIDSMIGGKDKPHLGRAPFRADDNLDSKSFLEDIAYPKIGFADKLKTLITSSAKKSPTSLSAAEEFAVAGKNYFFSAKDSEGFFKIGHQFYKSFKSGVKLYGFSCLDKAQTQQQLILGIASFIYYFENAKILVLTPKMSSSYYARFKDLAVDKAIPMSNKQIFKYKLYNHHGVHFLDVSEIEDKIEDPMTEGGAFDKIIGEFDVVLFDLPKIDEEHAKKSVYFKIFRIIENVTLSLSLKVNTFTEIEEYRKYFQNYNIKFNGCVVDNKNFTKGLL